MRAMSGLGWRWYRLAKRERARLMLDEVVRTFRVNSRTAEAVVREAHDLTLQSRLEGLVLARIPSAELDDYARVTGAPEPGSFLIFPSLSGVPLLLMVLARRHPGLTVYRPRGLPPAGIRGVGPLRDSAINRRRAVARGREEDRLGITWIDDPAEIPRRLDAGAVVAAAVDGRTWEEYRISSIFGRDALLGTEPWALARRYPVSAAFVSRRRDKLWKIEIHPPEHLDCEQWIRERAEPWLEEHPGDWAMWLAECRMLAATDDHPLFCEYATDERWRRWR